MCSKQNNLLYNTICIYMVEFFAVWLDDIITLTLATSSHDPKYIYNIYIYIIDVTHQLKLEGKNLHNDDDHTRKP